METQKEDKYHLEHMANSINEIQGYVKGMDYNDFNRADETKAAICHNLAEIGQAAQLLSDSTRNHFGDMDFNVLVTLGNAEFNNELERDGQVIYNIIQNDLDIIKENVMNASQKLEDDDFTQL